MKGTIPAILLAAATLAGCFQERHGVDPASIRRPAVENLTDGEITAIALAAAETELRLAQAARAVATAPTVREYAAIMAESQAEMIEMIERTARTRGLPATGHRHAARFQAENASVLRGMEGSSESSATALYLDAERANHHWYIAMLDNSMLPSVSDVGLRDELLRIRALTVEQQDALFAMTRTE